MCTRPTGLLNVGSTDLHGAYSGRITNMVILAHSSAALFAAPIASRMAGSLVLLGSYLFPSSEYHASLREFSRWVLCILRSCALLLLCLLD